MQPMPLTRELLKWEKMKIRQFVNLKPYNTFGIAAIAETFIDIDSETTLRTALKKYDDPFVLGGGSNMLLVDETIKQPVFHINIKGINEEQVDAETVLVKDGRKTGTIFVCGA